MKTRPSVGDEVIYAENSFYVRWVDGDEVHLESVEHGEEVITKIAEIELA